MGKIAKLLKLKLEKLIIATFESYYGMSQTAIVYGTAGDDSPPLDDERIALIKIDGQGKYAVVGTLLQSQGAKQGEKILFSRDADGKLAAAISLLNDGKITLNGKDITVTAENSLGIDGQSINLGNAKTAKAAARKDDQVKVTIPAGTVLVAADAGVPNPFPIELTGTIQAGSNKVVIE
ncbi:MAG: hypothetical protein ACRC4W_06805 [Treponemataceae bacterium]